MRTASTLTLRRWLLAVVAVGLYRIVLLAYPAPFRRRFGSEMLGALRRRIVDRGRPLGSALRFALAAVADGLRTARLERLERHEETNVVRDAARHAGGTGGGAGGGPRWRGPLADLDQDLRHALRLLRQRPGFTTATVLTLALGIGANTMIFTVASGMFLRPLPYADPGRLVNVGEATRDADGTMSASYPNYLDWRRDQQAFEEMALYWDTPLNLAHDDAPVRVNGTYTDVTLLDVLGVDPMLGRASGRTRTAPAATSSRCCPTPSGSAISRGIRTRWARPSGSTAGRTPSSGSCRRGSTSGSTPSCGCPTSSRPASSAGRTTAST